MAKRPYSLDFSIVRDTDRLHAVEEILDTLNKDPSATELEQMASYILYGKDENLFAVKEEPFRKFIVSLSSV